MHLGDLFLHGTTLTVRKFRCLETFKVPGERSENIEWSSINKAAGQIFQPVKNSSGVM